MIGSLNQSNKTVQIIGAGASGLFAAYAFVKQGWHVELFERKDRVGGMLQTTKNSLGFFEQAANSLVLNENLKNLAADCRIDLIQCQNTEKFIWRNGKARKFPLGFRESMQMLARLAFARAGSDALDARSWGKHHLGPKAAEYLIAPMIAGIFGANASEIQWSFAFPSLQPRRGDSLLRHLLFRPREKEGKRVVVWPRGGMGAFVDKILAFLLAQSNFKLNLSSTMDKIDFKSNIVLATSAADAGKFVGGILNRADIAGLLNQVKYSSLRTTSVVFAVDRSQKTPRGLGMLFPPCENAGIMGILYSSSSFAERLENPESDFCLTIISRDSEGGTTSDPSDAAIDLTKKYLKINSAIKFKETYWWPNAIPVYSSELQNNLAQIKQKLPEGVVLAGNYCGQVSLRGMLDSAIQFAGTTNCKHK